MNTSYDDMLHLSRPVSPKHPPMPAMDRAAQFAPFAALTGYDAAVKETARLTDRRIELDEHEKAELDERIHKVALRMNEEPEISVTYFVPDKKKDGGAYVTVVGTVKKIDGYRRTLIMEDGRAISLSEVIAIDGGGLGF